MFTIGWRAQGTWQKGNREFEDYKSAMAAFAEKVEKTQYTAVAIYEDGHLVHYEDTVLSRKLKKEDNKNG